MVKKSERFSNKTMLESRTDGEERSGITELDADMYIRVAPELWEEFTALAEHEQEAVLNEARRAIIQ